MPPASATSARLRLCAESLGSLAACARTGADEMLRLYPEVGEPRVQATLERVLDEVRELLSAVDVSATELSDDLALLAGGRTGREPMRPDDSTASPARSRVHR